MPDQSVRPTISEAGSPANSAQAVFTRTRRPSRSTSAMPALAASTIRSSASAGMAPATGVTVTTTALVPSTGRRVTEASRVAAIVQLPLHSVRVRRAALAPAAAWTAASVPASSSALVPSQAARAAFA